MYQELNFSIIHYLINRMGNKLDLKDKVKEIASLLNIIEQNSVNFQTLEKNFIDKATLIDNNKVIEIKEYTFLINNYFYYLKEKKKHFSLVEVYFYSVFTFFNNEAKYENIYK